MRPTNITLQQSVRAPAVVTVLSASFAQVHVVDSVQCLQELAELDLHVRSCSAATALNRRRARLALGVAFSDLSSTLTPTACHRAWRYRSLARMDQHAVRMPALVPRVGGSHSAEGRQRKPRTSSASREVSSIFECAVYGLALLGLGLVWVFFFAAAYGFSDLCPKAPLFDASSGQASSSFKFTVNPDPRPNRHLAFAHET